MNIPNIVKKITVETCRALLGCVFVFSGFVKAVDPWGGTYKNLDYLDAFGLDFYNLMATPMAFGLSAVEFALGICLLMGVYRRFHSVLVFLFMLFMTPLTLYLAIANPVTDCGCFGDAIVISNWATFGKNLVLMAAAICVFVWYKYMTPFFTKKTSWLVTLYTYVFILGISLYCLNNLPILDFRPYKIGANLPELMQVPEGAAPDVFETTFIYEKDGKEQEFTLQNYPANDSTWRFVDSKTKLIKKGYTPPIHDFMVRDESGVDLTDDILSDPSYSFLLISPNLKDANDSNVDNINEIYDYAMHSDYKFRALTASPLEEIQEWSESTGAEYPFYISDERILKTIVRSNPGLVLLKDGVVINKWSNRNLPSDEVAFRKPLDETEWGSIPENKDKQRILILSLALLVPMAILFLIETIHRPKVIKQEGITTK